MSGANAPATNVAPQDQGAGEQRSHEPSMEEILASIRRIISDDQMLPLSPRASVPPLPSSHPSSESVARTTSPTQKQDHDTAVANREPEHQQLAAHDHKDSREQEGHHDHHDVLDLADVASSGHDREANQSVHEDVEPTETVAPADASAEPTVSASAPAAQPASVAPDASPMTAALPRFAAQSHAEPEHEPILSENTVSSVSSSFHQLAATMLMQNFPPVDQIARELLRPMIKTWLDDNLPVMVERLVRAEIERVARTGR